MQVTPQIAIYVFLLLPGLLGHTVFSAFTYTSQPTWSGRTVVGIILSIASYVSLALLRDWSFMAWLPDPKIMLTTADGNIATVFTTNTMFCVVMASMFALMYASLLTAGHNNRVAFRIAQAVGLTTRSGFMSEWDSMMLRQARTRWVLLLMKDGTAFAGWLESHDVASQERCLVLSKIREYDREGQNFEWPVDELLVLNSLADVRCVRLIPVQEVANEKDGTSQSDPATESGRSQISESESKSSSSDIHSSIDNQTLIGSTSA